jgi:hypothetical protein
MSITVFLVSVLTSMPLNFTDERIENTLTPLVVTEKENQSALPSAGHVVLVGKRSMTILLYTRVHGCGAANEIVTIPLASHLVDNKVLKNTWDSFSYRPCDLLKW